MSEAEYRRASDSITAQLKDWLATREFSVLAAYRPHRREYDPQPVVDAVLAEGRRIALPRVVAKGQALEFRLWRPGEPMAAGAYDIPYPAAGAPVSADIMLVPLLGFDRAGYRLGYGGGYYDRTLGQAMNRPIAIGVGFELGRLATIDPLPHDVPMDAIVTEAGMLSVAR